MIRADAPLIEAARQGDRDAIVRLLSVCQPDLKRFARRTCSNAQDAEDAVQLALWQLYRRVGALRATAAFATWLFRIVERECWRLLRGRGRTESLDAPDAPPMNLAAAPIPHGLRLDLARAMERLSPPYREVLILRDVHELTAPETAAQLGLSVEAVKSRLHRARAKVREHLLASGYWVKDDMPQEPRDVL
ncbi:MAG: RNA polymerase sigma factor [Delftia acidovorans]|uniref:RNA polymerase sigma factor n=1 Tax=Delftia acidovorans TaxID=80866 RepID=A0A7T2S6C6_DELAC|nr:MULTISPECIES: RNA polymerase sigma factor [Delftia]MBB1651571.1 RNA polymerase subunit sigma-70 [Delftia sp. UME58]MBL8353593.1 RNA polymerase sigma factor [Delftia acidovorans]QPS09722.1 RNA polymerase sigma factor [Delftia acidovorans]